MHLLSSVHSSGNDRYSLVKIFFYPKNYLSMDLAENMDPSSANQILTSIQIVPETRLVGPINFFCFIIASYIGEAKVS